MLTVTGSALVAFIDAVASALTADIALSALATVYDALPRASSTTLPYVAFGRRSMLGDGFAMGRAGVDVTLEIDTWSEKNGPFEATLILGHVRRVLTRNDLRVSGFTLILGSVMCEYEEVFEEPDADMPERTLYHGVSRWRAQIEESL